MTSILRLRVILIALLTMLSNFYSQVRAEDGPSPEILTTASAGVVQVIARECEGDKSRTGSGFLWDTRTQLVTALHVISGCSEISAYFTNAGEVSATLTHALLSADLAMLNVSAPASAHPLSISATSPQVNDTLAVIGYYFGVSTLDSRPLHVTLGSPILGNMVPDKTRKELQSVGSPSLATRILRLDGNLLPGLSGAPVIDAKGRVVGIGSGGLKHGTVGVSWAIQADYLTDLENSPPVATSSIPTGALFSAPAEGTSGRQVRCGEFTFAYVRTGKLQQLLATADDIPGLFYLARSSGLPNNQIQEIKFDIYAEQNSGGSVALPEGTDLIQSGNQCVATIASGLEVTVVSSKVVNQYDVQQQSVAFENAFNTQGLLWRPDISSTYLVPLTRPDGLVVRRKNFLGFEPFGFGPAAADVFETLMTRQTRFIGVRAVNTRYNLLFSFQQCRWMSGGAGCADLNEFFSAWVATTLGLQMSTFPPT